MDITKAEVQTLLKDEKLMEQVVAKSLEDPDVISDLAEGLADEISDILEDDPTFKQKILSSALKDPKFKSMLLTEIANEMGD